MGLLLIDGSVIAYTLERPDKHAPAGIYRVVKEWSPNKGIYVYELCEVPGMTEIQIHIGNTLEDLDGCIAIGSRPGVLEHHNAVIGSAKAFSQFMKYMNGAELSMSIQEHFI